MPPFSKSQQPISPSEMRDKIPKGRISSEDEIHAVLGGWMTQEAWDKVKYDRQHELTSEETESFKRWRSNYQTCQAQLEKAKEDHGQIRKWIEFVLSQDPQAVPAAKPTSTTSAREDLGLQCFLLSLLPKLCLKPSWMEVKDWVQDEIGLESIDDLYPVIDTVGKLYTLDQLIFNFGYGPDYFDWTAKTKPFQLKGVPACLYLVEIDVGLIAGKHSCTVFKIGITTKDVIGTSAKTCRFHGDIANHTRVLRSKTYRDARDAYMVEQTVIKMSRVETFHDRQRTGKTSEKLESFKIFQSMLTGGARRIANQLGYTEWIFPFKSEKEVTQIFDTLTSYGEFHGDGNTAYSLFQKEYQDH